MTSQPVIFRAFFSRPPTLNLNFFPRKSTDKKILAWTDYFLWFKHFSRHSQVVCFVF